MELELIIPFISYFLIVIGISVFTAKFSSKGISEYFLADRKLNYFVVGLSSVVSGRSAWLMLGFTGLAYMIGFSAIWSVLGYIIVELILFLYLAPKFRDYTEKHDCITIPDFFAARFNDTNGFLRITVAAILMLFMTAYIAAQFVAGGKAFSTYFEITPTIGIIITAIIVLIYTTLGGFWAASLNEVLQAVFMLLAIIGVLFFGIVNVGGWEVISLELSDAPQINALGNVFANTEGDFLNPFAISIIGALGAVGIGLGSAGSPYMLVRYMSIKNSTQFKWTAIAGTVWNILLAAGALLIGLVGRAYISNVEGIPQKDVENIFLALAENLLNPNLMIFIGVVLAVIFAAIMSSANSQLLIAASAVVRDIYQKIVKRNQDEIEETQLALLSRFVVILFVVLSVLLGIWLQDLVFWIILFAWAGFGASIGTTLLLAIFWKPTNKSGVIAGLFSGTITVVFWKLTPALSAIIYELIPAFFVSLTFTIIVSLLTNKNSK